MPTRWNNVGIVLAVLAGLTAFGVATWPIAPPQARGDMGAVWGVGQWIVGLAFIGSAFLVDRHVMLAKTILAVGSLLLVAAALISAEVLRTPTLTWLAVAVDLLPVALGLLAAALIGPVEMSQEEWRARHRPLPTEHRLHEQGEEADRAA